MAQILAAEYHKWLINDFLTWQWFANLAFLFLPWLIWWIFVDRKRLPEILFFGVLISLACVSSDAIGVGLKIWSYPHPFLPGVKYVFCSDFGILPVSYMMFYQHFSERHAILGAVLLALGCSYIGEPVYVWLGLYDPGYWRYSYTIPLYLVMFLGGRALTRAVFREYGV
ncbi:MAG: CBO0543 family protein [Candidatus Saccharibacteria bacterium]